MKDASTKLRLGPLPKTDMVKLTVTVTADLKAQLDAYAEVYSRVHTPTDVLTLVPHMIAAFIERDRGFKAMRARPPARSTTPTQ